MAIVINGPSILKESLIAKRVCAVLNVNNISAVPYSVNTIVFNMDKPLVNVYKIGFGSVAPVDPTNKVSL